MNTNEYLLYDSIYMKFRTGHIYLADRSQDSDNFEGGRY